MPPPVPGRFTTPPESSPQVVQHIQKSDSSDNVCPSKSSPENSKKSPIFSPPENNAAPVTCDIPLASSPQDRLNDTHAPPSFVPNRPESEKTTRSHCSPRRRLLFLRFRSIPAIYDNKGPRSGIVLMRRSKALN